MLTREREVATHQWLRLSRALAAAMPQWDGLPPRQGRQAIRALARGAFRQWPTAPHGGPPAPLLDAWLDAAAKIRSDVSLTTASRSYRRDVLSVVIPVRGAHDRLARCVEMLARSSCGTDESMLVTVACAGSESDAARDIARCARGKSITDRIEFEVVTSVEPQGFPANVNLAAAAAPGRAMLILNSDAYVGAHALATLRSCVARDGVVAAGPCANNVSGIQGSGRDLPAEFRTQRLVGFCVMVDHYAFDLAGCMWEGYGLGNWDDDDLSLRLSLLGELVICGNARVEHEGGASFAELPDPEATYARLLEDNKRKFEDRWSWLLPDWTDWMSKECAR